ncbi:MAG: hypothetical protein JF886_16055, partial [Candidatus Dormibacteraeota bacterium]|nr:hypothetical protein [Candidatus Dormibacteraeota bacterium]
MTVLRRIAGVAVVLGGVVAAALIVVGVPLALAKGFGWPLPHAIPSWSEVSAALQGGIPDIVWVDTLACVCWAAWLYIVTTLTLEAVATLRGVVTTGLALTGPGQRLAASLIATVIFGVALLSTRPTPSRGAAPLAAALRASQVAATMTSPPHAAPTDAGSP